MASSSSSKYLSPNALSKNDRQLMTWPLNLETYYPALTFGSDAMAKMSDFEKSQLSRDTAVQCIRYFRDYSIHELVFTEDLFKTLHADTDNCIHELLFLNRFIIKSDTQNLPKDMKRLRISKMAFRHLLSYYEVPPLFLIPMLSNGLASPLFHHRSLTIRKRKVIDFFYILPIRVAVTCTESARSHVLSTAGSNQMDPSQYLHLNDTGQDIRPSKIAVYMQHDEESHRTSTICIDFQDGRWSDLAEEPFLRTKEVLQRASKKRTTEKPFFIHLLLLTSVSEWWRCTLMRFNKQLIVYEKQLQQHMYNPESMPEDFINETNKDLHTMVAHLHRYNTETDLLEQISNSLSKYCRCSCINQTSYEKSASTLDSDKKSILNTSIATQYPSSSDYSFESVALELRSLRIFVAELKSKTQTTLDLLFNNIRMANDKLLVANGESMRRILQATSAEAQLSRKMAKQSQKMAIDMRRDSTSMKTIAVMTMFFLPATSYAAILSMPFFSEALWMADADRAWLWVVLSIPSTIVAFAIYYLYVRRGDKEINENKNNDVELNAFDDPA